MNVFGLLNLFSLVWKWLDGIQSEKIRNSRSRWSEQEYEPVVYAPIIQKLNGKLKLHWNPNHNSSVNNSYSTNNSYSPNLTGCISGTFWICGFMLNHSEIPKRGIYS